MSLLADTAWMKDIEGEFAFTDPFARYTEIVGLTIRTVTIDDEVLRIRFTDGRCLTIADEGQSCCEHRYMTCDDDLSGHEGGHLLSVDLDAAAMGSVDRPDDDDCSDVHETQFVRVQTTKGSFTLCTHNNHNGYYGGFSLAMRLTR